MVRLVANSVVTKFSLGGVANSGFFGAWGGSKKITYECQTTRSKICPTNRTLIGTRNAYCGGGWVGGGRFHLLYNLCGEICLLKKYNMRGKASFLATSQPILELLDRKSTLLAKLTPAL